MTPKERAAHIVAEYEALERFAGAPEIDLSGLTEREQEEAKQYLAELEKLVSANPLHTFRPHEANAHGSRPQLEFLAARTRIVAAFAGNRFGKSSALVVKSLCQALSPEDVPEHLRLFRQVDAPCHGWLMMPTEEKLFDSIKPAFEKWCPKSAFRGGSWGKAYNGERKMLTFANGSTIGFKSYSQDSTTLGGADLDFVGYDEPPPKGHRNEGIMRMARGVREWYAMTPIHSSVAWIRREIWRNRESPDITVVRASIHENRTLAPAEVAFILSTYSDTERQSRETGDFMDNSGLVYANMGREGVVIDPLRREFLTRLEHVWAIDPGIRNAAVIAGGFDQHGVDYIYDEILIRDGTPSMYIEQIDRMLKEHGLIRDRVLFAIDPAARQRSQATGDTVQSELARLGLHTISGVRDREVGQQQIRDRLLHGRLKIVSSCVGLRDDADEFAYPQVEEGKDPKVGPADDSPYHRLATLRYQVMVRPWYPQVEAMASQRNLGWQPGRALPVDRLKMPVEVGPLGALS
jgi:phage terminase large subunit-like protein